MQSLNIGRREKDKGMKGEKEREICCEICK
jgi:hypothetical protein